ncbi:unnamed protein product, partial [Adineta steineri]
LTLLQTRGINLILSVVTNMSTTTMDVPLRPQEGRDLVNRVGRLITSLNHTIEESHISISLEQTITRKLLSTHRKDTINRTINPRSLRTQQNISTSSKRPIFRVHTTAHCQGMIFSTTLLSTLEAQYKIGVANTGGMKSPATVSSDNHVRINFPEIRCYGNYSIQQEQENKTKVFVTTVIIHERNEIIEKISGFDQFHFGTTKHTRLSLSSKVSFMRIGSIDTENENEDEDDDDDEPEKDQQTTSLTLFTYKIDMPMKGFE